MDNYYAQNPMSKHVEISSTKKENLEISFKHRWVRPPDSFHPLHTREVFPEVFRGAANESMKNYTTGTGHFTPPVSIDPAFFFSVSTREFVDIQASTEKQAREGSSLIIPLNGKPISRFVPRRLASTGARDKREKLKNDVRLRYEERLCVYPLHDELLSSLKRSPRAHESHAWIVTTSCLIRDKYRTDTRQTIFSYFIRSFKN